MQTTENSRIFIGRQIAFDEKVFREQIKELAKEAENECPDICYLVKKMGTGIPVRRRKTGMTDLHVHILPGVDDGSPNLSTSLEMAEMAAQSGVRILAVTPHANQTGIEGVEDGYVNYDSEQLLELFYRLEQEIRKEHIPISLVRGMEIMSIGPLNEKNQREKADTAS